MKKSFTIVLLICLLAMTFNSFGQSKFSKVKIFLDEQTMITLGEMGIPIEGKVESGRYLITEIETVKIADLRNNQIQVEVLIDDVSAFYVERNAIKNQDEKQLGFCGKINKFSVPENFIQGSMGGFFTLSEIYEEMDSMRARFPDLVSVKQTVPGITTHGSRQIYYLRISDNPDIHENEPAVLYQALVHAREPMGMQQLFFFMWYMLENYDTDSEIAYMLNNSEIYLFPCINPDGYEYNRQIEPSGGGMWRKNRRNNGSGSYGVDLNRNFGYMWGYDNIGSSNQPTDETYRGPSAFSEPETQAVKWFCETYQPTLLLDYHTYSDVLLFPWSYEDVQTVDSVIFDTYAQYLTDWNRFVYGTPFLALGYNANGGSMDWYYGEEGTKDKIIGFSPEAGNADDGFWPSASRIETIALNYMEMNYYLMRFALKYAEVADLTDRYVSNMNSDFIFQIQRLGMQDSADFTISLHPVHNVQSVGSPLVFVNFQLLQTETDTISYVVSPTVVSGDSIVFLCEVNNGVFSRFDTIVKIFGSPVELYADQCNVLTDWTGTWGLSSTTYYSPSSSITDSPSGPYADDVTKSITSLFNVNLNGAMSARVKFWSKWEIEDGWDYVQFFVSDDNGVSWTPMCGKYTSEGTVYQDNGNPLYDGYFQQWVEEEIDLNAFLNQTLKFRFTLVSDSYQTYDGFYFDDFRVEVILNTADIQDNNSWELSCYPNPVSDFLTVVVDDKNHSSICTLFDIAGKTVAKGNLNESGFFIDVRNLNSGMYILVVQSEKSCVQKKIIVAK